MARLDRVIQPPHVHAANEPCTAWMARSWGAKHPEGCGPWQWRLFQRPYHPRPNQHKSRDV